MKFEKLEIKIRHSWGARILVILRENNFLPQIWEGPELFIKNLWLTWAQCFTLHFLSLANISNVVLEKEPKMIKLKVLFKSTLPYLYPFICTPNPQVHTLRWYVDLVCILFSIKDWFFEWTISVSSSCVTSWKAC